MINLFYDCYIVLCKVYSDKAFIKQALLEVPIEEKNRAATTKICYGVLDKDIELSYYISVLTMKSPKVVIRTILKIAMYSIKYLEKKEYAVIQNAVELTKKLGKGGASGFVNAFLRKFCSQEITLPQEEDAYGLSVRYSFPKFAVESLIKYYGYNRAQSILSTKPPFATLVFYGANGEQYLNERNIEYKRTPFNNVYMVERFTRDKSYDDGIYTFQSLGSVAICDIIEPCKKLLDCCAAPGGKSVRLSYKCDEITSFDIHSHRVHLIEEYANRMKRKNILPVVADAKEYNAKYKGFFDTVLVDAPCSGLGVTAENPDIKLNRKVENIRELNIEQLAILSNVCKYLKNGGVLYYSTCSLLTEENYCIVENFLKIHNDFEIEKIDSPIPHEDINGTIAFLPDISGGFGFYIAKMRKK